MKLLTRPPQNIYRLIQVVKEHGFDPCIRWFESIRRCQRPEWFSGFLDSLSNNKKDAVAHYVSVGICEGVLTAYTVDSAETAYRLAGSIPATRSIGER